MSARRQRVAMMLVAVSLATGSLVASIGISSMAALQIDSTLASQATSVFTVQRHQGLEVTEAGQLFPPDSIRRVEALDNVTAAGLRLPMTDGTPVVRAGIAGFSPRSDMTVMGATAGYLDTLGVESSATWMLDRSDLRVVVLGSGAAGHLGVPEATGGPAGYQVVVAGVPHEVIEVLPPATAIEPSAVVLPFASAMAARGGDADAVLTVSTAPGAGPPVAGVAREALNPGAPENYVVSTVADVRRARTGVSTELARLAGAVGAVLAILTGLLVGNSQIVAVVARTSEIGLRRALGASPRAVAAIFVADAVVTGVIGGAAGSSVACAVLVGVAVINQWSAYIEPWYLAVGPVLGSSIALVASLYPAFKAARVSPAEAVRAE